MNFLADVYLIPAKRQRTSPLISESDFDLASKLGTKHYVPKILRKVKFAGGGGGDNAEGETAEAGPDDGGDGWDSGGPPAPNTPVGRSRAPTAAADVEEVEPPPAPRGRHRSQSRLRFESTAAQQPTDAPPPSRSRSNSKGPVAKAGGSSSITGFHLRQNVGAAATALLRGATGAAAAVANAFPKPAAKSSKYTSALGAPLGMTPYVSTEEAPKRGRSPTPRPRNIIFQPGSPPAARRSQSRKDTPMPQGARSRAASAASQAGGGGGRNLQEHTSPVRSGTKEEPKPKPVIMPKPAEELEIHAMKTAPPAPPREARRRTQSQAPPKAAAAAAAPPMSLYGTLKGQNVIMGARGGLTVETATGRFRSMTAEEKAQIVKKNA